MIDFFREVVVRLFLCCSGLVRVMVEVELGTSLRLPGMTFISLPDGAFQESWERLDAQWRFIGTLLKLIIYQDSGSLKQPGWYRESNSHSFVKC